MSTAAAVEGAVAAKAGKKKWIVIVLAALLLLGAAGGGTLYWLKARADAALQAEEAEDSAEAPAPRAKAARSPLTPPVFVPLDNFTVNLADREIDRYAQIGISLELRDAQASEQIKQFMPAIRNNILMVLAHKRSSELLEREGKEQLAADVLRETERALGLEPLASGAARRKGGADGRPVRAVHFSNFIVQ